MIPEGFREVAYILSPHTFTAAEHCPAARVFRGPRTAPGHGQWHGIAVHRFIEYAHTRGREAALGYIRLKFPRLEKFCEALDLSLIPPGVSEPQYLIDTKRELSILLDSSRDVKSEGMPEYHVQVKADHMTADPPEVFDWKTGERTVEPSTSTQSLIESVAVWLELGRPARVSATVIGIRKVKKEIVLDPATHVFTKHELEAGMKRIRRAHLSLVETRAEWRQEGIEPERVPGDHCGRCDARDVCPDRGT